MAFVLIDISKLLQHMTSPQQKLSYPHEGYRYAISGYFRHNKRVSKVFWGQSKNEIKFGGTLFQLVKLGANFGGLK